MRFFFFFPLFRPLSVRGVVSIKSEQKTPPKKENIYVFLDQVIMRKFSKK